jgi:thioredoxin reductase (NADPH)
MSLTSALASSESKLDLPIHRKVIIAGSGPAGYAAAIYGARGGLEPLIIAGLDIGGQLMITSDVENYPGYADAIQGPFLMDQMRQQAIAVGSEIVSELVTAVDFSERPFKIYCGKKMYTCDFFIIATGARAKTLGLPSEKKYIGKGVSMCATCDGPFFRGQNVLVVGGGNTAVEEAIFMAGLAKKVTLIHRRDQFRAEKIAQERLFKLKNVEIIWNTELDSVIGDENQVTGVNIRNRLTGTVTTMAIDGVFVAIGHDPNTGVFKDHMTVDEEGYIDVHGDVCTSVKGVFAVGDVADKVYRQAVTAASMGCMAALRIIRDHEI